MGALVGLGVGVGLLLVWSAFALLRRPRAGAGPRRPDVVTDLLARAGLGRVSAASLLLTCGGCALAAAFVVQVVSRTPPVAVAFGAIGGYLATCARTCGPGASWSPGRPGP